MHLKRWATALVALPLFILLINKGPPLLFAVFVGIVSLLALREYYFIVYRAMGRTVQGLIPNLGFMMAPALLFAAYSNTPEMMMGIIVLNFILSVLMSLPQAKSDPHVLDLVIRHVLGMVYIPGLLSYLILIRNGLNGIPWLFFLFFVVFIGDAAALYGGTLFGKHKLCPSVSPGKTIEGSAAGLFTSVGAGLLSKYLFNLSVSWGACVLLSLIVGIAAQIGDLFESQLKRSAKLKDSGGILPGHGGALDRIDATLFAVPVLYIVKEYIL